MPLTPTDSHRDRRKLGLLVLAVSLAAAIAAPTLVSIVAPPLVEWRFSSVYRGSLRVHRIRLGWTRELDIGPIELLDDRDRRVGELWLRYEGTLTHAISGVWFAERPSLGTVSVGGAIDLVRDADGSTNLARALEPARRRPAAVGGGGSRDSQGYRAPRPFEGTLRVQSLSLAISDRTAMEGSALRQGVKLDALSGEIAVDRVGKRWRTRGGLRGELRGASEAQPVEIGGESQSSWGADGLPKSVWADLTVDDFPIVLLDGILGMRGILVEALGGTADLEVHLSGNESEGTLAIEADTPSSRLDIDVESRDGFVQTRRPARIEMRSSSFLGMLPAATKLAQSVQIDEWPALSFEVDRLRLPSTAIFRPSASDLGSIDWRESELTSRLSTGRLLGSVGIARDGEIAPAALVFEPAQLEITVEDIVDGLAVTGAGVARFGGESAGSGNVELRVRDLVDAQGRATGHYSLNGRITQAGVAAALLQPLFGILGVDVGAERIIGPAMDELMVSFQPSRQDGGIGTNVEVAAHSTKVELEGKALLRDGVITTRGEGFSLKLDNATPLLAAILDGPVKVVPRGSFPLREGGAVLLRLTELSIDRDEPSLVAALDSARLELSLTNLRAVEGESEHGLDETDRAIREIVQTVIGGEVSVEARVGSPAGDQAGGPTAFSATVSGQGFSSRLGGSVGADGVRLDRSTTRVEIEPTQGSALLAALSGQPVRLLEPVRFEIEPSAISIGGLRDDAGGEGSADYRVGLRATRLLVSGFPLIDPSRRLSIEPTGSLSVRAEGGGFLFSSDGRLVEIGTDGDRDFGAVEVRVESGGQTGGLELDVVVDSLGSALTDRVLAAVGSGADLLGTRPKIVVRGRRSQAGEPMRLSFDIQSPRIDAREVRLEWDDQRVFLPEPEVAVWKPAQGFIARELLGRADALREAPTLSFDVKRAAWGRVQGGNGPFLPEVFSLDLAVEVSRISIATVRGESLTRSLQLRLRDEASQRGIRFELGLEDVQSGTESLPPSAFSGVVAGLSDARGVRSPGDTELSARGSMYRIPTALIDRFAGWDGAVAIAAGPYVDLHVVAEELSARGGVVEIQAAGERGKLDLAARVEDECLVSNRPVHVEYAEINAELVDRFLVGLPFVSSFEKRREDGPAAIEFDRCRYPLNGDLRHFDCVARIDLGRVRFKTEAMLGRVLQMTKAMGDTISRVFHPFVVKAEKGVLTYEKYVLPIGGEEIATSGTIDLVQNTIDMVLHVPHLMLAEKVLGNLRTGLSSIVPGDTLVLGSLTRLPIRVRGSLDDPEVSIDLKLFAEENTGELRRAGELILDLPRRLPIFGN